MMAIEDYESVFNSIFSLMAKSDDEDNTHEVTLFELKDDLGNLYAESLRKLVALLIDSVDKQSTENIMLTEKLSLFENENAAFLTLISEMSRGVGILEFNNKVDEEEPSTSENDKRKLSIYEEELEDKLKISESKLAASLETNSQLRKDLRKIKKELSRSLKWIDYSKIFCNISQQSFNGKRGLGSKRIEPPYNPYGKYVSVVASFLCTHCGRSGHVKERYDKLKYAKERHVKFVKSEIR